MDHKPTQDEALIGDMARRLFAERFPVSATRELIEAGFAAPAGSGALGESGLFGALVPEAAGGAGLGAVAALQIVRPAGRWLLPYPVADSLVAAAVLGAARPELAAGVVAGERLVVFAAVPADLTASGGAVSGKVAAVPFGMAADALLIEAGGKTMLIDLAAPGVIRAARTGIDPTCPMATVTLDGVTAGAVAPADPRWRRLRAILAAGELAGAAGACLDLAVDYMKVRRQFGQEIGRFQALKHIAADAATAIETMTVAADHAAWAHDAGDDEADMAAAIAKSYASEHARKVAEGALQCHGAIGFTWDYDLQLYLRRILRLSASVGAASEHRTAIAAMLRERLGERWAQGAEAA